MDPGSSLGKKRYRNRRPRRSRRPRAKHPKMRLAKKLYWQKWRNQRSIMVDHCYIKNNGGNDRHPEDYTGQFEGQLMQWASSASIPGCATAHSVSQIYQALSSPIPDINSDSNISAEISVKEEIDWKPTSRDLDKWKKTYKELSTGDHENEELNEFSLLSEDKYSVFLPEIKLERMSPTAQEH